MAEFETIRPINLPQAQGLSDNDIFVIDSETGGVRKVPKNKVYTPVDNTLTKSGEAADSKITGDKINELTDQINSNKSLIQNPIASKSGAIVTVNDGAEMLVKSLIAHIEPKQSGSGEPSPDNVRPISGWDSVNVTRSGKNLLPSHTTGIFTSNGLTTTYNEDGTITVNGTATANTDISVYNSGNVSQGLKGSFILNGSPNGTSSTYRIACRIRNTQTNTNRYIALLEGDLAVETSDVEVVNSVYIVVSNGVTLDNLVFYPMMRIASDTDASYEPYQADTYTTDLPETVYGGTLDVVNGVLTVDRAMVNLGTLNWAERVSGSHQWIANMPSASIPPVNGGDVKALCERYTLRTLPSLPTNGQFVVNNTALSAGSKIVCICDESYSSVAEFKTAITGVKLIYSLAEQRTIQLTPKQVTTLLGTNNVWSDSGEVDLTYRRDINIVLDELTQAIISLGGNV